MKEKIKPFLYFVTGSITTLTVITTLSFLSYEYKPPELFPLNDNYATYTVVKQNNTYSISYKSSSIANRMYSCTWGGFLGMQKESCSFEIKQDVIALVGSSPIELEPFLGKSTTIQGKFVYTNEQCINSRCVDIGNYAALDITEIKEAI